VKFCQKNGAWQLYIRQVITLVAVWLQKGMYNCRSAVCIKSGTDFSRPVRQYIQNTIQQSKGNFGIPNKMVSLVKMGLIDCNTKTEIQGLLCFNTALEKAD
jgi:hypothetical protein